MYYVLTAIGGVAIGLILGYFAVVFLAGRYM